MKPQRVMIQQLPSGNYSVKDRDTGVFGVFDLVGEKVSGELEFRFHPLDLARVLSFARRPTVPGVRVMAFADYPLPE